MAEAKCPIPLQVGFSALPCSGGKSILRKLFEPIGYTVTATRLALDDRFPEWGESPYFRVELAATVPLKRLLSHLYVLVPVLDDDKHYWVGDDQVTKLMRHGEGWLSGHPECDSITRRYLKHRRGLVDDALAQLTDDSDPAPDQLAETHAREEEAIEKDISLNEQRLGSVLAVLKSFQAARVLDLGCGEGRLLQLLLKEKQFMYSTTASSSLLTQQRNDDLLDLADGRRHHRATPFHVIDLTDPTSEAEGIRRLEELTGRGGEGMVVKPVDFIVKGRRGLVQPAVKCRGREYLRIIYGPEYTVPENMERLRSRGISAKRSLALREFALGIEALERQVADCASPLALLETAVKSIAPRVPWRALAS